MAGIVARKGQVCSTLLIELYGAELYCRDCDGSQSRLLLVSVPPSGAVTIG